MAPPTPIMKASKALEMRRSGGRLNVELPLALVNGRAVYESFLPSAAASPTSPTFSPNEAPVSPCDGAYYNHPYRISVPSCEGLEEELLQSPALPPRYSRAPLPHSIVPPPYQPHPSSSSSSYSEPYTNQLQIPHIPVMKRKLDTLRIQGQALRDEFKAAKRKLSAIKTEYESLKGVLFRVCMDKAVKVREKLGGVSGGAGVGDRGRVEEGEGGSDERSPRQCVETLQTWTVGRPSIAMTLPAHYHTHESVQAPFPPQRQLVETQGQKRKRTEDGPEDGGVPPVDDETTEPKVKKCKLITAALLVETDSDEPHLTPDTSSAQLEPDIEQTYLRSSYAPTSRPETIVHYSPAIQDSPFLDVHLPSLDTIMPDARASRDSDYAVFPSWVQTFEQLGCWSKHERTVQFVYELSRCRYEDSEGNLLNEEGDGDFDGPRPSGTGQSPLRNEIERTRILEAWAHYEAQWADLPSMVSSGHPLTLGSIPWPLRNTHPIQEEGILSIEKQITKDAVSEFLFSPVHSCGRTNVARLDQARARWSDECVSFWMKYAALDDRWEVEKCVGKVRAVLAELACEAERL